MDRSRLIFALTVFGLAASNVALQLFGFPTSLRQLHSAGAPHSVYVAVSIWLLGLVVSTLCAAVGSYHLLRQGKVSNPYLFCYVLMTIPMFGVENWSLHWMPVGFHFTFHVGAFLLGVNAVGVLLLVWYRFLAGHSA